MQTHILLEFDGDIATLTLTPDDPGKPPTLDYAALDELSAHIATLRAAAGLRVVAVGAEGHAGEV
jgi:enoyl-CoA hydratase/carnithine racemase